MIILSVSWWLSLRYGTYDPTWPNFSLFALNQVLHWTWTHFYGNTAGFLILGSLTETWVFYPSKLRYVLYLLCFCAGYPPSAFYWWKWGTPAIGLSSLIAAFFACLLFHYRKEGVRLKSENPYLHHGVQLGLFYGFYFLLIYPLTNPTERFYFLFIGSSSQLHAMSLTVGIFSYLLLRKLVRTKAM